MTCKKKSHGPLQEFAGPDIRQTIHFELANIFWDPPQMHRGQPNEGCQALGDTRGPNRVRQGLYDCVTLRHGLSGLAVQRLTVKA